MQIAVLTATYNRKDLLVRLLESLENQDDTNFIWIIIDDGSNDGTEKFISDSMQENHNFVIRYLKQKNGGKARALNYAFENNRDIDLFAIIDSDDLLLPTAICCIKAKGKKYIENESVGAIYFRYRDKQGNVLHTKGKIQKEELIIDRFEHDSTYSKDDGCISYFKRAVEKYKYPEYENEKYVGPIVLQMEMAKEYKIVFTNEIIGIAEYQENGLTNLGKKLRIKNPLGMIKYCQLMQNSKFKLSVRMKYAIMCQAYAYIGKISVQDLEQNSIDKKGLPYWAKIPGFILGEWWQNKYK